MAVLSKGVTKAHAVFKEHHSVMYRLIASCAGFGSSVADAAVGGGITTSTTLYYHPQLGDDANSGLTALLPKKTPSFDVGPTSNTKLLIASGSTITTPQDLVGYFNLQNDNIVFSCYDANTFSKTFGQEILSYENPFDRALLGNWVNESERLNKYYTIDGLDINNSYNDRAFRVGGVSVNNNICIRGAWLKNLRRNGIICLKTNIRIEDCVFDGVRNGLAEAEGYGGVAIRAQDETCNTNIARCWISGTGEDVMWGYTANTHTIADCAIIHEPTKQIYGEQHCDVFQFSAAVTNFTIRRVVAYHKVAESARLPNPSSTTSTGAFITDAQGTPITGGTLEDVAYITNYQGSNFEQRGGVTKNRCVEYMLFNPAGNTDIATFQRPSNQVNNGVMCKHPDVSGGLVYNKLFGAGALTESGMRYYNL